MNSQNKVFSERLKSLLKKKNMTQTELSEKTGISQGAISQYLMGAYEPKIENIKIISEKLNTNIGYLLGVNDFIESKPGNQVIIKLLDLTKKNKLNWKNGPYGEYGYYVTIGEYSIRLNRIFDPIFTKGLISIEIKKYNQEFETLGTCEVDSVEPLSELFQLVELSNSVNSDILNILSHLDKLDENED